MPDLPMHGSNPPVRTRVAYPPPEETHDSGTPGILLPNFPSAAPRRRRGLLPFLLMVVLPTLLGVAYYGFVAAPQYVTTAVFALRVNEDPEEARGAGSNSLMGAIGPATRGAPVTQSYGVTNYVASAPAMEDVIRAGLDLRAILTNPRADFLTRVPPEASDEALLRAWRSMVQAQFEVTRGVVTLVTRAFTPEESLALAEAVLSSSERLVNTMSERRQAETMGFAEEQVLAAERRVAAARAEIRAFRTASGVIDPGRSTTMSAEVEARLRQDLVAAEAQAETLRGSGGQGGPMYAAALARARAIRQQLMDAERQVSRNASDPTGSSWATILERFDGLNANLRAAERFHEQALDLLSRARAEAVRQRTDFLTFVRPVPATEARYPNRPLSIAIVAGCALLVWATVMLLYHAIRDQT